MSNNLSKLLRCKYLALDVLTNKKIAIDVMPLLYKYLYIGASTRLGLLKNQKGIITSYLYGLLNFLLKLKARNIEPVICVDGGYPEFKRQQVERRKEQRTNKLVKLQEALKLSSSTQLDKNQVKQYNHAKHTIGPEQTAIVKQILSYAGITVMQIPNLEAQKTCACLLKNSLVDYAFSFDKDLFLYGISFISHIDFTTNKMIYYDWNDNLQALSLPSHEDVLLVGIASGTDYHKGLFKIGPIKALKEVKLQKSNLIQRLTNQIPFLEDLVNYLSTQDSSPQLHKQIIRPLKNRDKFIKMLKELDFVNLSIYEPLFN
jgi:flap endonuclease-1